MELIAVLQPQSVDIPTPAPIVVTLNTLKITAGSPRFRVSVASTILLPPARYAPPPGII